MTIKVSTTLCRLCGKPTPYALNFCWSCGEALPSFTVPEIESEVEVPVFTMPIAA